MATRVNEFAPQIRRKESTFRLMLEFLICCGVLFWCAVIFYFVRVDATHGVRALLIGLISVIFATIPDLFWNIPVLCNKEVAFGARIKEYFRKVAKSYSYVTGLVLALLLPVGIAYWQVMVTAIFATTVSKLIFGGFGHNIFNPAIVGRLFAQLCFSPKTYIGDAPADVIAGASATGGLPSVEKIDALPLWRIFIGDYRGTLGETFAVILLIICVYLCIRKIIDYRVPVAYIGTLFIAALIMFLCNKAGVDSFKYALEFVLAGGIVFGAVICMTDPVTSPTSRAGRTIFALGCAFFTLLIRAFTSSPEGVAYSILIMNGLTPLIDKVIKGRTRKNLVPIIVCSVLLVATLVLGLARGLKGF